MPGGKAIFLDFDDTLSDQFQFNLQYTRAIGEILAPRIGGEVEAWAKSAVEMLVTLEEEYIERLFRRPLAGYCEWLASMRVRAAELLFGGMGLPTPPDAARLAVETQAQAILRCNTLFPGVPETLAALHQDGYTVRMASGQESAYLHAALQSAGLEHYPQQLFGPDLIDCAKEGPEFYARIFARTGVDPHEALIVDDHPAAIGWALQMGATVIQARFSSGRRFDPVPGIAALLTEHSALPGLVKKHHPLVSLR